jgi:hypothetical protein
MHATIEAGVRLRISIGSRKNKTRCLPIGSHSQQTTNLQQNGEASLSEGGFGLAKLETANALFGTCRSDEGRPIITKV